VTPGVARAPVGRTPTVRDRLARQRPRPVAVRVYAALLSEMGLLGPPARRRAARFLLRSAPAAVATATATGLVLRAFEEPSFGWPQAAALGALAVALGAAVWRRTEGAAAGRPAPFREQLELGALFVVAAYAVVQTLGVGAPESALQPLVYLVMAFLVAFLDRGAGLALVALASFLELAVWRARGGHPIDLPAAIAHAGFVALFALLYHAVLAAQIAAGRRTERAAVARRMSEIEERAREFRRLAAGAGVGEPEERARRWTEATVVEVEAAVRGAVEVAEVALRSHTCAVFLLTDDDESLVLRECRSRGDGVARRPIPAGEGALGGAVRRRAPVRLHGEVRAPSYYADGTRPGALLAVPLVDRRGGHVRGVVVADRLEPQPFTEEDERLLSTLAAEILRAVAAERLIEDMKRTRDETERFYAAIERLNRTTKPREVFDATLDIAREMTGAEFAALTLVERDGARTRHRVARVAGGEGAGGRLEGLEFQDDTGLVASAVRLASSLPGKELDPARTPIFDAATRLRGLAALKVIPLRAGSEVLGTLVLGARRAGAFPQDTVRQLEVVGLQAGDAILRARLFEQAERLATTDGLTGLTNHRTLQARLDEHLARAARYQKKLSLLLCDIDHFKSVNDTYGHPVGDEVLRGVARTLSREARQTDVVARYGGEEFAVVMPETDEGGALVIAERIREKIAQVVLETEQGPLRITMSLGIATFPEEGASKADLVERADACLYHAKRHGRNRSVSATALRALRRAG
jgi:two-component system cell cycle response regulator